MPYFASIINTHNKKIINNNTPKTSAPTCNCCSKTFCPLNGDCLQSSLVYIGKVDTPNIIGNHPHYIALTENTLKGRFYKHKNSFQYETKRNATELSNFLWENNANLMWNILDKARAYKPEAKRCLLCFTEKSHITFSKLNLLNTRNELETKCHHENKF